MMILIFCATVDATQWDVLFSLFPCATAASMAQRGLPGCAFWGGLLQWETPPCTAPMKAAVSLSRVYYSNFSVTKSINGDAVHYPSIEHIVALGILVQGTSLQLWPQYQSTTHQQILPKCERSVYMCVP
ncbi:hypothetical protein GBAR_LOCUS14866 [Geodia barretti]|uniref:Uncharacterized protein n=1 Tax=Geodia barretti TaxID=519541 RepID=A0AA35SAY8_GEOBA|nr:hypothetical protein GBAR_LOCUS14866 [Geodia barretti]